MRHKAIVNQFSLVLLVTKVLVYYYRSSWNIFAFCTMSLKFYSQNQEQLGHQITDSFL